MANNPAVTKIDNVKFSVKEMKRSVYLKIKDKKTGKSTMKLMPGLVARRPAESGSFAEAAKK